MATERIEQLSLEDFVQQYEAGAFELIGGERRAIMPPVLIHGWIIRTLFRILDAYCREHETGELLQEMPYVLTYDSNWVRGSRVPDLMLYKKHRWNAYIKEIEDWAKKPMLIVPDLAIEVVSHNDRYSEVNEKVRVYEEDGLKLIWLIDPEKKTVDVYEAGQRSALSEEDTLTGGNLLPNLAINLSDLFTLPKVED